MQNLKDTHDFTLLLHHRSCPLRLLSFLFSVKQNNPTAGNKSQQTPAYLTSVCVVSYLLGSYNIYPHSCCCRMFSVIHTVQKCSFFMLFWMLLLTHTVLKHSPPFRLVWNNLLTPFCNVLPIYTVCITLKRSSHSHYSEMLSLFTLLWNVLDI